MISQQAPELVPAFKPRLALSSPAQALADPATGACRGIDAGERCRSEADLLATRIATQLAAPQAWIMGSNVWPGEPSTAICGQG